MKIRAKQKENFVYVFFCSDKYDSNHVNGKPKNEKIKYIEV